VQSLALTVDTVDHNPWRRTMNADCSAKLFLCHWLNAMADFAVGGYSAEAPALAYRNVLASMGVDGYFMEVPRVLPVPVELHMLFVAIFLAQLQNLNEMSMCDYKFYIKVLPIN
jgi:hypothetical protein